MALLRATCTFHGPGGLTVTEGGLYDSADAVVKGREDLFESADAAAHVEVSTARPGSRSNARRNRTTKKTAAPKATSKTAKKTAAKAPEPTPQADPAGKPKSDDAGDQD